MCSCDGCRFFNMQARSSQQHQHDNVLAVLDIAAGQVSSADSLARLSATNRRCRAICAIQATHRLKALLLPLLHQAAAQPKRPLQQHDLTIIKWLCCTAGKQAVAAASDAVVAVPNVPAAVACVLTAAGVRVSDAQAMTAALKQQPGIELWLQARLDVHRPDAGTGSSSDAELCAAFSTVQQDWTSAPAAATAVARASSAFAAAPAAAATGGMPSLLEVLAQYPKDCYVSGLLQPELL